MYRFEAVLYESVCKAKVYGMSPRFERASIAAIEDPKVIKKNLGVHRAINKASATASSPWPTKA